MGLSAGGLRERWPKPERLTTAAMSVRSSTCMGNSGGRVRGRWALIEGARLSGAGACGAVFAESAVEGGGEESGAEAVVSGASDGGAGRAFNREASSRIGGAEWRTAAPACDAGIVGYASAPIGLFSGVKWATAAAPNSPIEAPPVWIAGRSRILYTPRRRNRLTGSQRRS